MFFCAGRAYQQAEPDLSALFPMLKGGTLCLWHCIPGATALARLPSIFVFVGTVCASGCVHCSCAACSTCRVDTALGKRETAPHLGLELSLWLIYRGLTAASCAGAVLVLCWHQLVGTQQWNLVHAGSSVPCKLMPQLCSGQS